MKKKQIVFYCATNPEAIIYKISKLLRKEGYETVLFSMCEKDRFDHNFYSDGFDKITYSNFQFFKPSLKTISYIIKRGFSFLKFLFKMKLIHPEAVIGVSGANWQLKLVHKYFFKKYPFIYFPLDILSHYYNSEKEALRITKKFELDSERYLFENTDGIIHKGDPRELKFINGRVHKNLKIVPLQLSFLPYCSDEFIIPINKNKLSKKDGLFHMVYAGGFAYESASIKKLLSVFKNIMNQGINTHLYVNVKHLSKEQEENYISSIFKELYENNLFHLHNPLNPKELIPEISKYDFGFWADNNGTMEPIFATGNKLASYLEAGIPFIYGEELKFIDNILKHYELSMSFNEKNLKNLKKRLQKINWKKIEQNILKARKELNMESNRIRLENFIEEVITDFKKKKEMNQNR